MAENSKEIEQLINQDYVPSSLERKRTVLMYALFGIVITLTKKDMSTYEKFHLKQSIGRRLVFMIVLMAGIVFFFLPYVRFLPIIFFLPLMIVLGLFVNQAWNGQYTLDSGKILLPIFSGLGGWILDVFELQTNVTDKQYMEGTSPSSPQNTQTPSGI